MDKFMLCFQLLTVGGLLCLTSAAVQRHKRNVMFEYNWPEPNPDINHFPHESSCHYYYLVLSEEDIEIQKCPHGELFDYVLHKCTKKETAKCWSRHFGKIKHYITPPKLRGHFRCPYAWGKYPDIHDCSKYYLCLSSKVKHKKCASFEHFDKISRKCVAEIDGVCADETDVVQRGYKCPRAWGTFFFPTDCSKYYECLQKRPTLRTCQQDTLFDGEECLPKEEVQCGRRRNPYGEKTKNLVESTLSTTDTGSTLNDGPSSSLSPDKASETTSPQEIKDFSETMSTVQISDAPTSGQSRTSSQEVEASSIRIKQNDSSEIQSTIADLQSTASKNPENAMYTSEIINSSDSEFIELSTQGGKQNSGITSKQEIVETQEPIKGQNRIQCPTADGLYPHPTDEKRFLLCENFEPQIKYCPDRLIFDPVKRGCVWHPILY